MRNLLGLLSVLAQPLQNPKLLAALGITNLLRASIDSLFGLHETRLSLGWQGDIVEASGNRVQQRLFILTQPGAELDTRNVELVNNRLLVDGTKLERTTYLVFSVEVSNHRPDWRRLDDIADHYERWNMVRGLYDPSPEQFNDSLSTLLKALRNSSYLVPGDVRRIIADEIIPVLDIDREQKNSLFRSAGIDLASMENKGPDEDFLMDFIENEYRRSN